MKQVIMSVFARFVHTSRSCFAAEKSLLGTLRKKTGYTLTNCKKALEIHENDISKAEKWLQEQAQSLGWSKASKLEGRQTRSGLIGVVLQQNNASLVEVNCETDFVARNANFKALVELATNTCFQYTSSQKLLKPFIKMGLDSEQFRALQTSDGKSLADHLALMIGTLGENALLRRAICVKVDDDLKLSGYAHPTNSDTSEGIMLGTYGALIAYKVNKPIEDNASLEKIGKQLCQHIVGMNPTKIGTEGDEPDEDIDNETCLIHQEFLSDPSVLVNEVLNQNGIEIVDFVRFECGENINNKNIEIGHKVEAIETCQ